MVPPKMPKGTRPTLQAADRAWGGEPEAAVMLQPPALLDLAAFGREQAGDLALRGAELQRGCWGGRAGGDHGPVLRPRSVQ